MATGYGAPQITIARGLGISIMTLRKYYLPELENGAARVELHYIGRLHQLSKLNDGTGLKAVLFTLQSRFGWSQFLPRSVGAAGEAIEHDPDEEPLGKKARANKEAQTAHLDENSPWSGLVQ